MHIIRYHTSESSAPLVGVHDEGQVFGLPGVGSLAALWALPLAEIRQRVAGRERVPAADVPAADVTLLPPIDGRTEVWAAGVTYYSSREARVEESERSADVYRQVYEAERPELFFKSAAWRVAGDGQTIAVRADSAVDVPEPEVALVINRFGEIAGYTACNDVSSRSIEGENPLYLPQAKIYLGGCALGPAIRPSWEVADPYDLGIELTIRRDGATAWQGRASTSALRRRFDDLAAGQPAIRRRGHRDLRRRGFQHYHDLGQREPGAADPCGPRCDPDAATARTYAGERSLAALDQRVHFGPRAAGPGRHAGSHHPLPPDLRRCPGRTGIRRGRGAKPRCGAPKSAAIAQRPARTLPPRGRHRD